METIRAFILSLVCASLISGILTDLSQKTFFFKQIKLVCSLFLALTALMPLIHWRFPDFRQTDSFFLMQAQEAVQEGEQIRIHSIADIIKDQSEAYILNEARAIGANISVEIGLQYEDPPIPFSSTIRGCFDASCELMLSRVLTHELGIQKEHQTWIRQEIKSDSS